MVGGRVGIRWSGIKAGVSMTSDRQPLLKDGVDFQNPTRRRLGGDFSASYYGVTVDAEYVKVSYDLTAAQEFMMSAIAAVDPTVGTGTTKSFYYGNVMYDISDQYFAYGGYSYLDDKSNNTLASGLRATTVGAGFRATDNVVIKGQYVKYEIKDATQVQVGPSTFLPLIALDLNVYVVAVSVFF
jgi:hypothetical protein